MFLKAKKVNYNDKGTSCIMKFITAVKSFMIQAPGEVIPGNQMLVFLRCSRFWRLYKQGLLTQRSGDKYLKLSTAFDPNF